MVASQWSPHVASTHRFLHSCRASSKASTPFPSSGVSCPSSMACTRMFNKSSSWRREIPAVKFNFAAATRLNPKLELTYEHPEQRSIDESTNDIQADKHHFLQFGLHLTQKLNGLWPYLLHQFCVPQHQAGSSFDFPSQSPPKQKESKIKSMKVYARKKPLPWILIIEKHHINTIS